MPKLPRISGQEAIQVLERLGFNQVRQKGSHVVLKREAETGSIGKVVPLHKEIAVGTLRGILRQAQISPDKFLVEKHDHLAI